MGKQITVYRNGRPNVTCTRHAIIISERLNCSGKSGEAGIESYSFSILNITIEFARWCMQRLGGDMKW